MAFEDVLVILVHEVLDQGVMILSVAIVDGIPCPSNDLVDLVGVSREGACFEWATVSCSL